MDLATENVTCPAVGYQAATVCVPVSVEPYAKAGVTLTKCCGNATVGEAYIDCKGASGEDICSNCEIDIPTVPEVTA